MTSLFTKDSYQLESPLEHGFALGSLDSPTLALEGALCIQDRGTMLGQNHWRLELQLSLVSFDFPSGLSLMNK